MFVGFVKFAAALAVLESPSCRTPQRNCRDMLKIAQIQPQDWCRSVKIEWNDIAENNSNYYIIAK
jgi:hypothetical protein